MREYYYNYLKVECRKGMMSELVMYGRVGVLFVLDTLLVQ